MFSSKDISRIKTKLLDLDTETKIKFIILFGSYSRDEATPLSDLDIAVYYDGAARERSNFRLEALGKLPDNVDVQIFQDLPLYIQKEVLEGKVLYCKNKNMLFRTALQVVNDFADFEPVYEYHLSRVEA